MQRYWLLSVAMVSSLGLVSGCESDGPELYPVRGQVLINGEPQPLVRVQFWHQDDSVTGNMKSPVGMTNDAGSFHLSTQGDDDGAVMGEYVVTFEWMSGNDLQAIDKLGGRFVDPARSRHRVTIVPGTNELEPMELTIDPKAIKSAPSDPQN